MKFNKGFTLIELLVVIAIIGILSSVVLASLTSARTKGAEAAIKSELANMRAQAELWYGNQPSPSYNSGTAHSAVSTANCAATPTNIFAATGTGPMITSITGKVPSGSISCAATAAAWTVVASTTNGTGSWCVDSTGASKAFTSFGSATGGCN